MVIYTIGHSTRSLDELVELLRAHHVGRLADIRTVPRSRRHPHFSADALGVSLPAAGVAYRHFPGLGGLRKPRKDSRNGAWRHEGFRGYADYMETAEFRDALTDLIEWGGAGAEVPGFAGQACVARARTRPTYGNHVRRSRLVAVPSSVDRRRAPRARHRRPPHHQHRRRRGSQAHGVRPRRGRAGPVPRARMKL